MDEPSPTTRASADAAGESASPPGAPRWAKVFAIIAAVVVVLFLILALTGGDHRPGRHLNGAQARPPGDHTIPDP